MRVAARVLIVRRDPEDGGSITFSLPTSLGAEMAQFLSALVHPTVKAIVLTNDSGHETHCLWEPRTSSWARITLLDVRTAQLEHGGPRDLWAEREPLLTHWVNAGHPSVDRYGLTVDEDGAHALWLDEPANEVGALRALDGNTAAVTFATDGCGLPRH